MQVRDVPGLGNIRVGHQVKPIGLDNNTSAAFLPFLERSDNNDAFYAPFDASYALGITARNWSESERATWQLGVYRPSVDVFGIALNKGSYGGRLTGLPVYQEDERRLVHLGLGTWWGELVQNVLRVRARPLLRNGPGFAVPILVDTGEIPGSRQYTLAPEFAMVLGSWTLQAEWAGQFLTEAIAPTGQPQGTVFYHGGYLQVLYFLTGEHQEYAKREGVFGRVIPRNDYHVKKHEEHRSLGAWQVGLRFGYLDLNDKGIQGGRVWDWTVGLNWVLDKGVPRLAPDGTFLGYIGCADDITERRQAEEGLRDSQRELRALTGRLLQAQETERRRIARDLHDDLNQSLSLLSVELDLLGQKPPQSAAQLGGRLEELLARVKQLSSSVHDLSHQLHPSKLEQLGFVAAVRGLCQELTQSHSLPTAFTHREVPEAIPEDMALCLYRIAQEALGNVLKHSAARHARVELSGSANAIGLQIVDDGVGFDPTLADGKGGLGLVSMRERLRPVSGEIVIDSRPSGGTRIEVRIPLCASGQGDGALQVPPARIG